ncbi:PTS sugar transporter subunit IIA [candidate division TA06 bacterium]|uniref:PTS sugar transporter subunit IIA n=1 Tax=candidate division TA06 bacterium TaxID=2250710 RepID=A0A523UR92_UNCT6|nr:MAG: PTS sugar transporter subunit IIA [candidate division TA06 bacterium]
MERISELLTDQLINLSLTSKDKEGVLEELADMVHRAKKVSDRDAFLRSLRKRENLESTGIGKGLAIPHARTDTVDGVVMAFARSEHGVDFQSLDNKPAHLIFLIASPEREKSVYIKVLARTSRLLRKDKFRQQLMEVSTPKEVIQLIAKNEI